MTTTTVIRLTIPLAVLAGLLGGASARGVPPPAATDGASQPVPATVVASSSCKAGFRKDLRKINNREWAHAYDYYTARGNAERVLYDQMRWALSDPEAHELIPVYERAAAVDRATYQPVVAGLRDDNKQAVRTFEAKYLAKDCWNKRGTKTFTSGIRSLKASFADIYKAHEQLFRVNLALQTAQMDKAEQAFADADLEAATISENWNRAQSKFDDLKW